MRDTQVANQHHCLQVDITPFQLATPNPFLLPLYHSSSPRLTTSSCANTKHHILARPAMGYGVPSPPRLSPVPAPAPQPDLTPAALFLPLNSVRAAHVERKLRLVVQCVHYVGSIILPLAHDIPAYSQDSSSRPRTQSDTYPRYRLRPLSTAITPAPRRRRPSRLLAGINTCATELV